MLDGALVGRSYPSTPAYAIGREKVAEFATAIGDLRFGTSSCPAAGVGDDSTAVCAHPAPPTFAFVIATRGLQQILDDPELGLDLSKVIHGDQRFTFTRPLRAGDEVVGTTTITGVKQAAGRDVLTIETVLTVDGRRVATSTATLFHAGGHA